MKNVRRQLLASAAGVLALGGSAIAADMGLPMKAPPAPPAIPYTNWQGFYVGGLVGAGRLNGSASVSGPHDESIGQPCGYASGQAYSRNTCTAAATGAVAGV